MEEETIKQMIKAAVSNHKHTGVDAMKLEIKDIGMIQQPAISQPSGGTVIDSQARNAINQIITTLKNLNLTK